LIASNTDPEASRSSRSSRRVARDREVHDAHGESPFFIAFLHNRPDTFVIGAGRRPTAASSARSTRRPRRDRSARQDRHERGLPSSCAGCPSARTTGSCTRRNFGYGYLTSFTINGKGLEIVQRSGIRRSRATAAPRAQQHGQQRPERQFGSRRTAPTCTRSREPQTRRVRDPADGSLEEVTSVAIPYKQPAGTRGRLGQRQRRVALLRGPPHPTSRADAAIDTDKRRDAADRDVDLRDDAKPRETGEARDLPGAELAAPRRDAA